MAEQGKKVYQYNKTEYVNYAEEVMKNLKESSIPDRRGEKSIKVTTSQIRNILSMVSSIYDDANLIQGDTIDEDMQSRIMYLKMRIAYEVGRQDAVKEFVNKAGLLKYIDTIGNSKENLILFCHYVEALVAYHKFYGGRD